MFTMLRVLRKWTSKGSDDYAGGDDVCGEKTVASDHMNSPVVTIQVIRDPA